MCHGTILPPFGYVDVMNLLRFFPQYNPNNWLCSSTSWEKHAAHPLRLPDVVLAPFEQGRTVFVDVHGFGRHSEYP
jgi:hypothetical protein